MRQHSLPAGTIPALLVGTIVRTVGEVVGFAIGATARSEPRMEEYELHKLEYTGVRKGRRSDSTP